MFRVTTIAIWIERGSVVAWEAADLMMRCRYFPLATINEIDGTVLSQERRVPEQNLLGRVQRP